ncbi:hypothetical protein DL89DRAFT_118764 [Linderina pennispora]|uniref:Secreted protein n=1 Tax=Linderina pennispora TaxID=61395 RepID=A0A1Y1VVG8_9FUNG|nr:uncharacterized protein DL89DRAFT_118764 [Linderina pennispora]ORX65288.1 hypothetical protein DL89DRAFT_118764 [Linderina pennispora]
MARALYTLLPCVIASTLQQPSGLCYLKAYISTATRPLASGRAIEMWPFDNSVSQESVCLRCVKHPNVLFSFATAPVLVPWI